MLRFKSKTEHDKEWRCWFCLHVRTATALLGCWHVMLHLLALGFLAAIARDPQILDSFKKDEMSWAYPQRDPVDSNQTLVYFCTMTITLMLVYGAIYRRAAYLLPFFCLQIFDFAITLLTAMGYLCYLRSMHRVVADTHRVPWKDQLAGLSPTALALIVFATFVLAIFIKGYCISVVWRCYKYLTMSTPRSTTYSSTLVSQPPQPHSQAPSALPDYNTLLPNYEDAVKQSSPPPSYHSAILITADPNAIAEGTPTIPSHTAVVMIPQQPNLTHV